MFVGGIAVIGARQRRHGQGGMLRHSRDAENQGEAQARAHQLNNPDPNIYGGGF